MSKIKKGDQVLVFSRLGYQYPGIQVVREIRNEIAYLNNNCYYHIDRLRLWEVGVVKKILEQYE